MKAPATHYEVQVNGKVVADATIDIADQLEINVASLAGHDGAVLALTAFTPAAPHRDRYVHTKNTVLSPGDVVTIALKEVGKPVATRIDAPIASANEEDQLNPDMTCSFCGKTNLDVGRIVAGNGAFICDECVKLCHEIVTNET